MEILRDLLDLISIRFVLPSGTWKKLNGVQVSRMALTRRHWQDLEKPHAGLSFPSLPFVPDARWCSHVPGILKSLLSEVSTRLFFTKKAEILWATILKKVFPSTFRRLIWRNWLMVEEFSPWESRSLVSFAMPLVWCLYSKPLSSGAKGTSGHRECSFKPYMERR